MGLESILTNEEFQTLRTELQQVRGLHTSYFEKLALLNGGTVGLVVTVVLGQMHAQLKHKYTLGVGLTLLVLAMTCLMIRNYYAVKMEMLVLISTFRIRAPGEETSSITSRVRWIKPEFVSKWAFVGSFFTLAGMLVLLAEVWMILW